jgi:putative peptidoglycan lipid II flippase
MRWQALTEWKDSAVREVARLMGPRVIGLAAYHLNFVIATILASNLGNGSISAINYAWLVVMTPLGLFGMSISTAAFPRMAEQAARGEDDLRETIGRALRMILFLSIPAGVGLMILAKPITAFLLQSGAFDGSSTDLVAGALLLYALALFAHGGIEILSRGFYALSDTRTPVAFAVVSMLVNLALALALVWRFEVNGLALALSIAAIVEFLLLLATLNRRIGGLDGTVALASLLRTAAATALMAELVALWLVALRLIGLLDLDSKLDAAIASVGGAAIGAAAFAFASRLLRSEEAAVLFERFPAPRIMRRGGQV